MKLISIHIPKTGGVTFRSLLKSHFGSKILYDYEDRPMSDPTFLRNMKVVKQIFLPKTNLNNYECIHGHFMPIKYKYLKNTSCVIWFRDPIERIVSRYFYMQKHSDFSSRQFNLYIKNKNISLEEFCEIPHFHNLYNKYLWGVSLEFFDFIGITENYTQSLTNFCNDFNFDISDACLENKNYDVIKINDCYDLKNDLKNKIYKYNKKDFLIYEKAISMS